MNKTLPIKKILSLLEKNPIVSNIETLETDEIFGSTCCKIRCKLFPTSYKLHITLLKSDQEFNYSYRLTKALTDPKFVPEFPSAKITNTGDSEHLLAKWDNTPHFTGVGTYPHHFHDEKGRILLSNIKGTPDSLLRDLKIILSDITEFLGKIHGAFIYL